MGVDVDVDVDVDVAVCERPKASKQIGQTSTSCLQKFTIHFRRPDKLKQNKDAPYKGQYGFDWLRDEYIYPMETVFYDEYTSKPDPNSPRNWYIPNSPLNKTIELCINPKKLKEDYLKAVPHQIKPHSQDYYPAWLSIFACNVQGDNADAGSKLHEDGVYLDLQLDEIDKIIDDRTEIIFKPSDPCLKITPEKISISEFLKTKRDSRTLVNNIKQSKIYYYYKLENAVKIICQGDTLKQHGMIKAFAKLGPIEYEVGQLMVYHNDEIGKANIVVVNVITKDKNNKKIIPSSPPSLEYILNNQSFNQALINVEINVTENFDLVELYKKTKNEDINQFLNNVIDPNYLNKYEIEKEILEKLCEFYDKYGKNRPKNPDKPEEFLGINNVGHKNTYLLFTEIIMRNGDSRGFSYVHPTEGPRNSAVIFHNFPDDDITIPHELAHTFFLLHTYEFHTPERFHKFYKGFTDNYMDYPFHLDQAGNPADSKYKGKTYSFFKWQWDEMRNDMSIKIMKRNK